MGKICLKSWDGNGRDASIAVYIEYLCDFPDHTQNTSLIAESCKADGFIASPFDVDELIKEVNTGACSGAIFRNNLRSAAREAFYALAQRYFLNFFVK